MDREQEKINVEEQTMEAQATSVVQENFKSADSADEMSYFLMSLRALRENLEMGSRVPVLNMIKNLDLDTCLDILNSMENTLPEAIQYGVQMFNERDRMMDYAEKTAIERVASAEMTAKNTLESARSEAEQILSDAEKEANSMLRDAQERADKLVSDDEIVQRAREEARIIRNEAKMDADEMKLKVTHEALQMLAGVEDELAEALNAVRRNRKQLDDDAQ